MCGRFSLIHSPEEIRDFFGIDLIEDFPPRYNIAPTQPILTIVSGPTREPGSNRSDREALLTRWGLLPSWLKDTKDFPLLINARSETAAEKNAFRAAMRHRRSLIPASGFYEWKRDKPSRQSQAYWVRPPDETPVAFAALTETWVAADGSEIDTAAILTTAAPPGFAAIHDRVPVVIRREDIARWLDCKTQEPRHVADLLAAQPDDFFEAVPVSDAVNKVANASPEIQARVEPKPFVTGRAPEPAPEQPAAQMKLF